MSPNKLQSLKDSIMNAGFVAIHFCNFESGAAQTIEHYHLIKPGEDIDTSCADLGRIPIISEEANSILQEYLDGKPVAIHPLPNSLD